MLTHKATHRALYCTLHQGDGQRDFVFKGALKKTISESRASLQIFLDQPLSIILSIVQSLCPPRALPCEPPTFLTALGQLPSVPLVSFAFLGWTITYLIPKPPSFLLLAFIYLRKYLRCELSEFLYGQRCHIVPFYG